MILMKKGTSIKIALSLVSAPFLMIIIMRKLFSTGPSWALKLILNPGLYVQRALINAGWLSAQTGGHMPDIGFALMFDLVIGSVLIAILVFSLLTMFQTMKARRRVIA